MSDKSYLDMIPPEQVPIMIAALVGLAGAIIGFLSWLFTRYIPKVLDKNLKASEARLKADIEKIKSDAEIERLKVQAELDETQNNREMYRLQAAAESDSRNAFIKIIDTMRQDAVRRDEMMAKYLSETVETYKGIQSNTAATLEFLKQHTESDEAMGAGLQKVIHQSDETHKQNSETHSKLADITSDLATILKKLESINVGQVSDRKTLDEIQKKVSKVQDDIKHLESEIALSKNTPSIEVNGTSPVSEITVSNEENK